MFSFELFASVLKNDRSFTYFRIVGIIDYYLVHLQIYTKFWIYTVLFIFVGGLEILSSD